MIASYYNISPIVSFSSLPAALFYQENTFLQNTGFSSKDNKKFGPSLHKAMITFFPGGGAAKQPRTQHTANSKQ